MVTFRRAALGLACVAAAALVGLVAGAQAAQRSSSATSQDVTLRSSDGTRLAATLRLPAGPAPSGGWPAVVFLHGLAGDRASALAIADRMRLDDRYAVLAYDARGHGESDGLVGIDGPKEVADARAAYEWLRDRGDVSDTKIGGWGISYGGGALLNSLVAGVPWAALEVSETWTDLGRSLFPQQLVKSGVIVGFLTALRPDRVDPEVLAIRDAAFAGDATRVTAWAAARSSLARLKGVRTPIFFMQGRRDFAFGLDEVTSAWSRLAGPKRLWIGLHGHAPSSFPAPDTAAMLAEGTAWFDTHLRGVRSTLSAARPVAVAPERWSGKAARFATLPATTTLSAARPVAVAPERWSGKAARFATLPATTTLTFGLPGTRAITPVGKVQRTTRTLSTAEVFGSPVVTVRATATGGWSRLVAVLTARTPGGEEIVVAGGGVPTRAGTRSYAIRLGSQVTFVPRGSRLRLTLASSSTAQSSANLLYLDLPLPAEARVTIGPATLRLPVLRSPVTR